MTNASAARWSWKAEPVLMARLREAQNSPRNEHRDIMTFAGLCDSRAELERHVVSCEGQAGMVPDPFARLVALGLAQEVR
jgi:hypothetical protein